MNESRVARHASLWVLPVATGGCGACVQSIYGLLAPRYAQALRRAGITVARSARHADVILLTGPLTTQNAASVEQLLEAVPTPRALVAVGDCAVDGCVFQGSPLYAGSLAERVDAHVEIAGCPPAPEAILSAVLAARALLAGESAPDAEEAAAEEAAALADATSDEGNSTVSASERQTAAEEEGDAR